MIHLLPAPRKRNHSKWFSAVIQRNYIDSHDSFLIKSGKEAVQFKKEEDLLAEFMFEMHINSKWIRALLGFGYICLKKRKILLRITSFYLTTSIIS